MSAEYKCECCGNVIERRVAGEPACALWGNSYGYETVICIDCMMTRADRVEKILEANKGKTWKDVLRDTD